jgi:hypothetical protein
MEPEGSLPQSQEIATFPCPGADRSGPCPHSTSRRSTLILSFQVSLDLPRGLLPWRCPHQNPVCCIPCPFLSTWFYHSNYIWRFIQLFTHLLPRPFRAQVSSSVSLFRTRSFREQQKSKGNLNWDVTDRQGSGQAAISCARNSVF